MCYLFEGLIFLEKEKDLLLEHIIVRRIQAEGNLSDEKLPVVLALAGMRNDEDFDIDGIVKSTPMQSTNVSHAKELHKCVLLYSFIIYFCSHITYYKS